LQWGVLASAIVEGILVGGVYALVSMGLALVWGVMEIINFAHGDYMMLGAITAYFLYEKLHVDPLLGALVALVIVYGLGVATQRGVINKILDAPLLTQVSATFGLLMIIRYGTEAALGPYTRRLVTSYSTKVITLGPVNILFPKLITFIISLIVLAAMYVFLYKTDTGIAIRATAQDRNVAQLVGINIKKIYDITFGLGVGITALGGALITLFYPIFPEMGAFFALIAFIVVVLGGFGSVFGAYLGGIIIGLLESLSAVFVDPGIKDVITFIIFIIIIIIKPTGLFGRG
jgi:branched-chain amino acid transport system permease protein